MEQNLTYIALVDDHKIDAAGTSDRILGRRRRIPYPCAVDFVPDCCRQIQIVRQRLRCINKLRHQL